MLDQFYSYLSDSIIKFFNNNLLLPGAKYNIQFETEEQVKNLYEILKDNQISGEFNYTDKNGDIKYSSYILDFGRAKLIIAATIDNVQPDFLTRLRNMVGLEEGYEDKAILFIHNTTLDSIMGGTESFIKEGMPFHIDSIQDDIKNKLEESSFCEVDKTIIKMDLDRKKSNIFEKSSSVFEYSDILKIINGTCINKYQYKNFGLFHDSTIQEYDGTALKKRLNKNADLYNKVYEIHNYGNPEVQLEKYFDDKGIDKLKKPEWKDVDYRQVEKSIENKTSIKPLEYISCSESWDKEEGSTKVKSRIRNIIVFNENNLEDIDLEFSFDDYLRSDHLNTEGLISAAISGKKIKANIKYSSDPFYKIIYKKDNIKFEIKIVMVCCNEACLESIKTNFTIKMKKNNKYISIKTNETKLVFNQYKSEEVIKEIEKNSDLINLEEDKRLIINIKDSFEYENDSEFVRVNLKIGNDILPIGIEGTTERITSIEGIKVWKYKREHQSDFTMIGENKLQHGMKDYFTREDFRRNLELEKQIIDLQGMYFEESIEGLVSEDLDICDDVKEAYYNILNYYKTSSKLPSLAYLDNELKELYEKFINIYISSLNEIREEEYLTKKEKNLFKIGVIHRYIGDRETVFTPLHPLNIAYQLHINDEIKNESITDEAIKKLSSTYLLPYINLDDKLFIPVEQYHSPEWKYYVDQSLPRYKSSRNFVSKLVNEKIEEFVDHFSYIFNMGEGAALKINLINTGDSKEILQGIVKYYVRQLRKNQDGMILPIDLYIYSDKNITNAFEEVAFSDDINNIKEIYELDLTVDNMSEDDVLNLYRDKVHFYSKKIEEGIEYSHITFLEMNQDIKTITSNMEDIPSGVIHNGLISGVPSVFLGDSYRTGFGIKYANIESKLMCIAKKLNAINAALAGEPFNGKLCKALSVQDKSKYTLDKIYDSSHWVTFIDPKVDLNFFKNDPEAKDLLIIHYSDQFTTAGGYDAITVTRKSKSYQKVIEDFLEKRSVENYKGCSANIINMFNAINGDWLLRLLSSKSYFPKEKISILSAIKLALAKFKMDNITWIPISLEEVLRVSGGAGLKQSEGFLSAKNLGFENSGSTSDDILLIGIENKEGEVFIHYYPIEVKIGQNKPGYIDKGIVQAKTTKKIFDKTLLPDEDGIITSNKRIYRNFLMQLVITSAEKLNLYEVCKEENWDIVIKSDIRRKLLNEEYEISKSLENIIGEAAVISFKRNNIYNDMKIEDGVMLIELSEEDGINFINKNIKEIRDAIGENSKINDEIDDKVAIETVVSNKVNEPVGNEYLKIENSNERTSLYSNNTDSEQPKAEQERNMEILFGVNQSNNKELYWYPNDTNKVFHTNTGIIGTMGTGKTQFTKSMITQLYRESKYNVDGKKIGILIFDYKGDYNKSKQDFIKATDAKVYELYHLPFNPLSITMSNNMKPMLPLHIANGLKETLTKAFGLGIKQETLLRDVIMEAYKKKGIEKGDKGTWDKPAPTLKNVYDNYISREDLKEDSLYATFSNLIDFEIFEPDPLQTKGLFELIDGVTVIDLSGYDPGIQNLVVAITLDLFYSQMQANGHSKIDGSKRQLNKVVLVDEADNFLSKNFESLKKILKEGREFGVGTILSTQLLSHFSTGENDYANYILTWVIHNVADLNNRDVKYIFNTQSKQDEEMLFSKIKSLNKHYSLVKMGDSNKAIHMKDMAFWELNK